MYIEEWGYTKCPFLRLPPVNAFFTYLEKEKKRGGNFPVDKAPKGHPLRQFRAFISHYSTRLTGSFFLDTGKKIRGQGKKEKI